MITAVQAVELLGRQVTLADDTLLRQNVKLMGIRVHPENNADYLVDVDTGHCFTGSHLTQLAQYTADESQEAP